MCIFIIGVIFGGALGMFTMGILADADFKDHRWEDKDDD